MTHPSRWRRSPAGEESNAATHGQLHHAHGNRRPAQRRSLAPPTPVAASSTVVIRVTAPSCVVAASTSSSSCRPAPARSAPTSPLPLASLHRHGEGGGGRIHLRRWTGGGRVAGEIRRRGTGGMIRSESGGRRGGGGCEICRGTRLQRERNSRAAGRSTCKKRGALFSCRELVWISWAPN